MTGGGNDLKNQEKSYGCISKSLKNLKYLARQFSGFLAPRCEEELCRGSILIEFAVCMPILIILLFYINDLVKIKRYYSQTEFVGQQMANIIQNISKGQPVTIPHLKYAISLALLSVYPGKTMYSITGTDNRHELSHDSYVVIHYVKGLSGGKASVLWNRFFYQASCVTPLGLTDGYAGLNSAYTVVKAGTDVEPSTIYPTLKIKEGEVKIIIEVQFVNDASRMKLSDYVPSDDQPTRAKKAFGCRLITPKNFFNLHERQGKYFPSVVIFTPKKGLFTDTRPPS